MPNERLVEIWDAAVDAGRKLVAEKKITEAELDAAGAFLTQVAAQGQLVDMIDLMTYTAAADQQERRAVNPNSQVVGPRWKAGAPVKSDGVLYEGEPPAGVAMLKVTGRLYERDSGKGLEGAQIDFWHARHNGEYDLTGYDQRGKIVTGADGHFEFTTLEPGIYKVHDDDLVEVLMERLGRTTHRSRHIHLRVWIDGQVLLTSQFYDSTSPYLDTDMLFASVRPELMADWKEVAGPDDGRRHLEAHYDIPIRLGGPGEANTDSTF